MKIGLVLGRFQPFTIKHESIIKTAIEQNDIVFIYIIGNKISEDNPFNFAYRKYLIETVFPDVSIINFNTANLDLIGDDIICRAKVVSKTELFIYCGEDRGKAYQQQLPYINGLVKDGIDKTNGKKEILHAQLIILPRDTDISGTFVRQALNNNTKNIFCYLTPRPLWDKFEEMRGILIETHRRITD